MLTDEQKQAINDDYLAAIQALEIKHNIKISLDYPPSAYKIFETAEMQPTRPPILVISPRVAIEASVNEH